MKLSKTKWRGRILLLLLGVFVCIYGVSLFTACDNGISPVVPGNDDDDDEEEGGIGGEGENHGTAGDVIPANDKGLKISYTNGGKGTGTLVSKGMGARTFYIDAENGDDSFEGLSPVEAWKSFKNTNGRTFRAGDRILLEADSIWNGTSVNKSNFTTLLRSEESGMLYARGNGEKGNPIVIDLYDIKFTFDDSSTAESFKKGEKEAVNATVYYSAGRRPIINGNGTPSFDSNSPYAASGAVNLVGQSFWEIRNIEVTNSFDIPKLASDPALKNTHWYKREVIKELAGINVASSDRKVHCEGIVIENCYVHDVQSLHNNNGQAHGTYTSNEFGGSSIGGKGNGGIIVCVTDARVEGNIIKRVGLEGLRTNHSGSAGYGQNIVFKGNYIETAAGDGIVYSASNLGLVESNLVKDPCAAPNTGPGNYAGNWAYIVTNTIYQYNETWGTLYGYLDGEAWDVDGFCNRVIYQYNYSHDNAGGACLFMGTQENSIFRYNISARDGGGSAFLNSVTDYEMDTSANTYVEYPRGQSIFHYAFADLAAHVKIPLIHNNTFYIGDGYAVSLVGQTSNGTQANNYTRFYNNIVLKEGSGDVRLSDTYRPGSSSQYSTGALQGAVKGNLFWAPDKSQFKSSSNQIETLTADGGGNIWEDPKLEIQGITDAAGELTKQRNDVFPEDDFNDPQKLKEYISVNRLRTRAGFFSPGEGSPAIESGMVIPVGNTIAVLDGAWNGTVSLTVGMAEKDYWTTDGVIKDFFGNAVNPAKPPIGAAAKVYSR